MSISQWPEQLRPRERLLKSGPQVLSDAELLAVFLRTGAPGQDAVSLAADLLARFGSLRTLIYANRAEFTAVRGLGTAKYAQLQAVVELARRAVAEQLQTGEELCSPCAVKDYLRLSLSGRSYESFHVLFLDVRNRLIEACEMFRGTLTHTSVYPREVVREALARNAAAVMLAHNHPSGCPQPSESDVQLTRVLGRALELVDVRILDHFVVAGHHVHSFAEHGQI